MPKPAKKPIARRPVKRAARGSPQPRARAVSSPKAASIGAEGGWMVEAYKGIINAALNAFVSVDENQKIILFNEAAERMFRYSPAEILGQPLDRLIPAQFRHTHQRHVQAFGETGHSHRMMGQMSELTGLRANGEEFPIEVSISQTTVGGKKVFTAILRDLTDIRQSEVVRTRMAALVDSSDDAILSKTLDGTITSWNKAAELLLGYTAEEIIGRPVSLLIPPDRRQEEAEILERLKRGEHIKHYETLRRRKDGKLIELSLTISPIRNAAGVIVGASKIARDITLRKQAESSLKLFRALVDQSDDAFEIVDPATARFLDVNEKGCKDLGYTREELLQLKVFDIDPSVREPDWVPLMRELRRQGSMIIERVHQRRDGTAFPIEINMKLVRLDREYVVVVVRDITERKRAEETLRFHETLLKETGHIAKVGGWFFDVPTGKGFWTEEVARIHDLDPAAPITKEIGLKFYTQESRPLIEAAVQAAIERATPYDLKLEIVSAKGVHKWVRTIGHPMVENGQVVRVQGSFQDITELKKSEQALELFRALVDRSHDAFEVIDPATGRLLDANIKSHTDLGYTREEMLQLTVFDISPEMNPELWKKLMQKARQEGFYTVEASHLRKDGTSFPIEVNVRWVQLDRNYVVSVVRDTTERKRQEQALRESEERFREIAENIHEVFWVTNPAGAEILYVSPAYEKIWGRTCQSLYASPRNWIDAIHPEDQKRVHAAFENMPITGGYDEIYRIVQPEGAIRWIHDRGFQLRNKEGEVYRVVGIAEDITKQRKLEEQFRQAQKMEAIGTLAGGIAHDFNNILAAVSGYAELCKMKVGENSPIGEYLEAISQAGARATGLVRQILTFSRQQEQQRQSVRLCDIVDESIKLLRATIPATIEFVVTKAPKVPTVFADPTQIHQILMNLGTNAWHAMRDRTGRLEVKVENFEVDRHFAETRPRLRPGPYVRISVADTGCGMSEATLSRMFEPFFTTKAKGEGTGLGLAVVHGIMESHDGVVTVYSKPGEGTIFHLYFPAQAGQAAPDVIPSGPTPLGQGRILYVDDEEPLAKLGKKTLEQLGYQVEMSTKVAEALEWVRQDPARFDLVITDQTMPGMTGTDFAAQLLKLRPDLPIILTTGYSAYLTIEHIHTLGIRDLLLKPHTLHTLGVAVHHALTPKKPK